MAKSTQFSLKSGILPIVNRSTTNLEKKKKGALPCLDDTGGVTKTVLLRGLGRIIGNSARAHRRRRGHATSAEVIVEPVHWIDRIAARGLCGRVAVCKELAIELIRTIGVGHLYPALELLEVSSSAGCWKASPIDRGWVKSIEGGLVQIKLGLEFASTSHQRRLTHDEVNRVTYLMVYGAGRSRVVRSDTPRRRVSAVFEDGN